MPQARELKVEDVSELYEMLTFMRPHGSAHEQKFVARFINPLQVTADAFGNIYKQVGPDNPHIIWSSHLDTVHSKGGFQHIVRDEKFIVKLAKSSQSNCLGADDTAGVWLMVQMIKAGVPGLYIFHRGEEVGCKGSKWIMGNNKAVVDGIKFVVALDRRDKDSVITFQMGSRTCSDDFAKSMGDALSPLKYVADKTGSFTDSAHYTDVVGECTNLSVGYSAQHGWNETLDLKHLARLYEALARADFSNLVSKRKPGEKESRWGNESYSYCGYGANNRYYNGDLDTWRNDYYSKEYREGYFENGAWKRVTYEEWLRWRNRLILKSTKKGKKHKKGVVTSTVVPKTSVPIVQKLDPEWLAIFCTVKDNPDLISDMLMDWGFTADMVKEALLDGMSHEKDSEGREETLPM